MTDMISRQEAEAMVAGMVPRVVAEAKVAAALAKAGMVLIDLGHVSESGETLAREISAITPSIASAALDALLAQAREEGARDMRERAAALCARVAKRMEVAESTNAASALFQGAGQGTAEELHEAIRKLPLTQKTPPAEAGGE